MAGPLKELGRSSDLFKVFVETGTFQGATTQRVSGIFEKVYTIELSNDIFEQAQSKLGNLKNVTIINGDSARELTKLCLTIGEPAVFFLDAHYSGGATAHGGIEVPIYEELRAIASRPWKDLIIIDDYRLFGESGTLGSKDSQVYPLMSFDWSDITLAHCLKIFSDNGKLTEHFIFDDRIYLLQSGVGLEIESLTDLGIGEPHPNLSTLPPSATISVSLTESTQIDGVCFDSAYGNGLAITPFPKGPFGLNLVIQTNTGEYDVWLQYSSMEPRPVSLSLDGTFISNAIAGSTTGGWYSENLQWHREARIKLAEGAHSLRLDSDNWFPHISRLALARVF